MAKILIVEDEAPVREMLRFLLLQDGMEVREAQDAVVARQRLSEDRPDLLILDWMLPGQSGVALARDLRQHPDTREIPIIMLTARAGEDDKVQGLESGADDYVTKPFSPREFLARVKALLRRVSPQHGEERMEIEGLSLDPVSHRVLADGENLELGPTEFRLLRFFMSHPERVYSRAQILDLVWGFQVYVEERTVDVHIRRLRKALAGKGYDRLVQTVRGAGYRFSART
jgi:two-component system phosphate regulon response regulator PhoB